MINESEIKSLVALLDDDDDEILAHIQSKLLSFGKEVVPFLEQEWQLLTDQTQQQRLEGVIQQIQYQSLTHELKRWYQTPEQDLLQGVCIVARFRYPNLDAQQILNQIDQIRLDIWLEMHYDLSPFEKVRIINHTLYNLLGFKGNTEDYHSPENSFINIVLESKKGNPIMLAVVYILLAQRLHLPVFGVNLPQHFVCAFKEENHHQAHNDPFNLKSHLDYREGRVLFYINPFNKGSVFSKANLEQFLHQMRIETQPDYFEACSNLDIVKRILRNLVVSYEKSNQENQAERIKNLLLILGETYFSYNEENPEEEE